MAARVSGSSSTRMMRTGDAGSAGAAGETDWDTEEAGAAEGSGTGPA